MSQAQIVQAAIFAQTHLDEPMPLGRLAALANISPHHFHRLFTKETGETPARFVERLRIEKAAFHLLLHDDPVVCIAMDCGYANHETLTRAFRRHFGISPREYRRRQRFSLAATRKRANTEDALDSFELSPTKITQLRATPIAFIRTLGPYENVDTRLWTELVAWADKRGLPTERMLIGIGHDAPGVTPPEKLRFDACITVPAGTRGDRRIRVGALPALQCCLTTHVGSYQTLPNAYPEIFNRAYAMKGRELAALPAIEIYRDNSVDTLRAISTTDVYLPVR